MCSQRNGPNRQAAVFRFTLSFRDVEDMLAERGIEVSYETIRQWVVRFGPAIARHLRSRRPRPHGQWHLDEMFVLHWRKVDVRQVVNPDQMTPDFRQVLIHQIGLPLAYPRQTPRCGILQSRPLTAG